MQPIELNCTLDTKGGKRIEIDSVLARVGNEQFWNFIIHQLNQLFPKRDYNRAIQIPEYVMPMELHELIELSKKKFTEALCLERAKIKNELSNVTGFIDDVQRREKEIEARLRKVVTSNKDINAFLMKVEKLKERLLII